MNNTKAADPSLYVHSIEADDYFNARLYSDAWTNATSQDKHKAITMATNMLDLSFEWSGEKSDPDQPLSFPRKGMTNIPKAIKTATMELALMLLQKDLTALPETAGIQSVKVDSIEVEFDATDRLKAIPDSIAALVKPFIATTKPYFNVTR